MQDISDAMKTGLIDVTDKIDVMQIDNFKEASQLLKARIKRNKIQKQKEEEMKIKMNEESQINISKQASAAKAEIDQLAIQGKLQVIQAETEKGKALLTHEALLKSDLMKQEGEIKKEMYLAEQSNLIGKETYKEDRKDDRENLKASNQSDLAFQKQNKTLPKRFNSENETVSDGIGLGEVGPNIDYSL